MEQVKDLMKTKLLFKSEWKDNIKFSQFNEFTLFIFTF